MLLIEPSLARNEFLRSPELGMGYQFAQKLSARKPGGERFIVIGGIIALDRNEILFENASTRLRSLVEFFNSGIFKIHGSDRQSEMALASLAQEVDVSVVDDILPSEDIQAFAELSGACGLGRERLAKRERLHSSPPHLARTTFGQKFVRFSAFKKDFRILPDGSVMPGTFLAPASEIGLVASGLAAVGRYALPKHVSAMWRFDMVTPPGIDYLYGTVMPNFGQAGGGVEVELKGTLPSGSVGSLNLLPEL